MLVSQESTFWAKSLLFLVDWFSRFLLKKTDFNELLNEKLSVFTWLIMDHGNFNTIKGAKNQIQKTIR